MNFEVLPAERQKYFFFGWYIFGGGVWGGGNRKAAMRRLQANGQTTPLV